MRDGKLGDADGMGEVDIDQAVSATSRRVLASWGAGGTIEVAPMLPMRQSITLLEPLDTLM